MRPRAITIKNVNIVFACRGLTIRYYHGYLMARQQVFDLYFVISKKCAKPSLKATSFRLHKHKTRVFCHDSERLYPFKNNMLGFLNPQHRVLGIWRHKVSPLLHHGFALLQVCCVVVYVTNEATVGVRKLALNPIPVISAPVHLSGEQVAESVG